MMKRSLFVGAALLLTVAWLWAIPLIAAETQSQTYSGTGTTSPSMPPLSTPGLQLGKAVGEKSLVTVSAEEIAAKTKNAPVDVDKQRRLVGVHVEVPAYDDAVWERLTGPQGATSWRLAIVAPGAKFLRAHFAVYSPGATDVVVVYGELDPAQARRVRSVEVAGETDVWAPPTKGERLHVEVLTSSATPPKLVIDRVSYGLEDLAQNKEAGCYLDPTCYAEWDARKTGIGHVSLESGGGAYVCSGALLNDTASSGTPWFLTANHCVSTQAEADTVVVSWRFFTDECNGDPPDFYSTPYSEGSEMSYTHYEADITLLELDEDPPDDTSYFGWTSTEVEPEEDVTTLHHPDGAYMRITFGQIDHTYYSFIFVLYSESSTEGGSSGAPLLNDSQQVVGVLSGGDASCYYMEGLDEFGKFNVAYGEGMNDFLDNGDDDDIVDDDVDDDDDDNDDDDDIDDDIDDDDDDDDSDDDDDYLPPADDDDDDDDQGATQTRDDDSGGGMCG